MYDLVIIGAGPGGIALAAEAGAAGLTPIEYGCWKRLINSAVRAMKHICAHELTCK